MQKILEAGHTCAFPEQRGGQSERGTLTSCESRGDVRGRPLQGEGIFTCSELNRKLLGGIQQSCDVLQLLNHLSGYCVKLYDA